MAQAQTIVAAMLSPYDYDAFFETVVGRRPLHLAAGGDHPRSGIAGPDPIRTLLDAHRALAPKLTSHSDGPTAAAPAPGPVESPAAFQALIRAYHVGRHTVRIPEVATLTPALAQFVRALELLLEKPVDAAAFWSAQGAGAPVHYDEHDIIAIQLVGRKRWFVSSDAPTLANPWKRVGERPPSLDRHVTIDMEPGDLLYLPRGTPHTVQSTDESIHLSIGFVPVTVRDALMAVLDQLADLDRPLRQGACDRADRSPAYMPSDRLADGMARLSVACRSDAFVREALDHRASRAIGEFRKLEPGRSSAVLAVDSRVRQTPLAIAKLVATDDALDFCQPGGRILVHRGVEPAMSFIADTVEFTIADIPGDIGDDIRIALARRLIDSGFLEPIAPSD